MLYKTDNLIGYYAAVLENIFIGLVYTFYIFAYILFYIGLCSCFKAFLSDLKNSIVQLNEEDEQKFNTNFGVNFELHNDMLG